MVAATLLFVTDRFVASVLRNVFKMRFRKVKRVAFGGNSERSLVLRQLYAKVMLEQLSAGKRLIAIDETWLSESDFRRRKWRLPESTNSVVERAVTPRISVITAIDTEGNVYNSMTIVNTDSSVFRLFLAKLADKLYQEDS